MAFVTKPLSALPKRESPKGGVNLDDAKALMALVFDGTAPLTVQDANDQPVVQTASDGVLYTDTKTARVAANKAKRLLLHVLPTGWAATTRIYHPDGSEQYEWALWVEKAEEAASDTAADTAESTEAPATEEAAPAAAPAKSKAN